MSRLFRAVWADRSLLLVLVPVALLLTAFLANRTAAEQTVATSATSSTTSTTEALSEATAEEAAGPPTTQGAETETGFATGGRTVTDDAGNLVRIPNDVARLPDAEVQGNVIEGIDPAAAPTTTPGTPTTAPTATTTPTATSAPVTTSPNATTTTVPGTTTTTTPVEPNPVVPESPLTIMLPVSGIVVVGLAWIAVSRRRPRVAR